MRVSGAVHTDRGRVRRENQDSYGFSSELGFYLVADGMGGQVAGKRASEGAVYAATQALQLSAESGGDGAERLKQAVERANSHVWNLAETDPALHGMGTTVAAILVAGDVAHIGHVGDSRVYRIRDGAISRLTRDHSFLDELAAQGIELEDQKVRARYGSLLTRAVGVGPTVEVEVASEPLRVGDIFVICSDGVYRQIEASEIASIVAAGGDDLAGVCSAIVERSNAAGGPDNSTVIVLRADPDPAPVAGDPASLQT